MGKTERRPLTETELRRAAAFKRAWEAKKSAERLSQTDAGDALDMSPSAFGQYINARVPIGVKAAIDMCHYLNVSFEDAMLPIGTPRKSAGFGAAASAAASVTGSGSSASPEDQIRAMADQMTDDQLKDFLSAAMALLSPRDSLDVVTAVLQRLRDASS